MFSGVVVGFTTVCVSGWMLYPSGGGDVEGLAFKKIKDIDVDGLLDEIKAEDWKEITARQDTPGTSHSETETIFLRCCKGHDLESVFNDTDAVDYPWLDRHPEFKQILREIFHAVDGVELGRALLVKLKEGGRVDKHIDEGAYSDYYQRFHLCLSSADNVFFMVDQSSENHYESVIMKPGELWWFDHKKPHCVDNLSDVDRIHLIVDVKTS